MSSGVGIARIQAVEARGGHGEMSSLSGAEANRRKIVAPGTTEETCFENILSRYRGSPEREAVPELAWITGRENRVRWAGTELEAVLLRDLLHTLLPPGKGSFWGKGPGVEVYSSLFLEEIARELARSGQFGIADVLVDQLQE